MPSEDTAVDAVRGISRRRFVKAAGASGIAVGVAGCTGGDGGDGGGGGGDATPISTKPPQEDVTVQFAADGSFQEAQQDINRILHNNGLPDNITLKILGESFSTDDRRTKFNQVLKAGQKQPTLLMMDNGWTIPFIARGQIQNLSASLPSSIVDRVKNKSFDAMVSTATRDGNLYGVPLFTDFGTIQYRKDLLRQAGYSDSDFKKWATKSMTWAKFSQIIKQTQQQTNKAGFNFQAANYEGLACCDFVEWMSSWGGAYFGGFENLFGPVGDRPVTVDEQPVVDALNMVRHFIHGGQSGKFSDYAGSISPQAVVQYQEESSRTPFTNGNVIAHRNWPYSIAINGAKDAFGEDLGVMPIPYAVPQSKSKYDRIGGIASALGGHHVVLNPNATDTNKRAALQVYKALVKENTRLSLFELGGWIPPEPALLNSKRAQNLDVMGRYVDSLKVAGENAVPRPSTVVWPQEASQISKEVNASLRQEKAAKQALTDLKNTIQQIEKSA